MASSLAPRSGSSVLMTTVAGAPAIWLSASAASSPFSSASCSIMKARSSSLRSRASMKIRSRMIATERTEQAPSTQATECACLKRSINIKFSFGDGVRWLVLGLRAAHQTPNTEYLSSHRLQRGEANLRVGDPVVGRILCDELGEALNGVRLVAGLVQRYSGPIERLRRVVAGRFVSGDGVELGRGFGR